MKNIIFISSVLIIGLLASSACSDDENRYEQTISLPESDSSLQLVNKIETGVYYSNEAYEKAVEEQIANGERTSSVIEVKNDTLNVYTAQWLTQPTDSFTINYWTYGNTLRFAMTPYYDPNLSYAQVMTLYTCKLQFIGDLSKSYTLE